jgi:hypothetical protein
MATFTVGGFLNESSGGETGPDDRRLIHSNTVGFNNLKSSVAEKELEPEVTIIGDPGPVIAAMIGVAIFWIAIAISSLVLYSLSILLLLGLAGAFAWSNASRMTHVDYLAFGCAVVVGLYGAGALGLIAGVFG